jgi:dipeptidyl aminopeptidase/acylaminoacyl peptidase
MVGMVDRILLAVDAAAASPETAAAFDPDRVALLGHSYGGYTTMAAITQSNRFRAAVAISGISNLITNWEYQPSLQRLAPEEGLRFNWSTGYTESSQGGMGVPPWSDPDRYIRNSPVFAADKIVTPLLLLHGDQDVVDLAQSEAMFSALFRQSKDAQLVTYWGEGHAIMSPGNVRDMYTRIFDFLDARLALRPDRGH